MAKKLIDQLKFNDNPSEDKNIYKKNIWKCFVCKFNRHIGSNKSYSKVIPLELVDLLR